MCPSGLPRPQVSAFLKNLVGIHTGKQMVREEMAALSWAFLSFDLRWLQWHIAMTKGFALPSGVLLVPVW